jgi:hypothetical protein
MATKYTKWPQNIPNCYKIYQMASKYTKWLHHIPKDHIPTYVIHQHLPFQVPPKFTQIGIFGLKNMLSGSPALTHTDWHFYDARQEYNSYAD